MNARMTLSKTAVGIAAVGALIRRLAWALRRTLTSRKLGELGEQRQLQDARQGAVAK